MARAQGYETYALSFRYGQRHIHELKAADTVARALGVSKHVVAQIDLREFGSSALTTTYIASRGGTSAAACTGMVSR